MRRPPLLRPADLKPMKLWVWAGYPAYVEAWKDAGYHPVELASTETAIVRFTQGLEALGELLEIVRSGVLGISRQDHVLHVVEP